MPKCKISLKSPTAKRSIKQLKKKFQKAESDIKAVLEALENKPSSGDVIPGFEEKVWKKRFKNTSAGKGKRGGFRIIYFWEKGDSTLYPLFLYSKNVMEDVPKKEILEAVKDINGKKATENN